MSLITKFDRVLRLTLRNTPYCSIAITCCLIKYRDSINVVVVVLVAQNLSGTYLFSSNIFKCDYKIKKYKYYWEHKLLFERINICQRQSVTAWLCSLSCLVLLTFEYWVCVCINKFAATKK